MECVCVYVWVKRYGDMTAEVLCKSIQLWLVRDKVNWGELEQGRRRNGDNKSCKKGKGGKDWKKVREGDKERRREGVMNIQWEMMWEELLFVLRLLSLRKDKNVGVVSNIYWHKPWVCACVLISRGNQSPITLYKNDQNRWNHGNCNALVTPTFLSLIGRTHHIRWGSAITGIL